MRRATIDEPRLDFPRGKRWQHRETLRDRQTDLDLVDLDRADWNSGGVYVLGRFTRSKPGGVFSPDDPPKGLAYVGSSSSMIRRCYGHDSIRRYRAKFPDDPQLDSLYTSSAHIWFSYELSPTTDGLVRDSYNLAVEYRLI